METQWHRNHTTLPTLDEVARMQLEVVRTSSVNSRDDWRSFSKEMTREFEKASLKLGRLNTVWGMKLNFALRTALAALLAACYAMQPAVHRAEWENATVFAPVLAVACVSGPSLGATLEHASEMWKATVIGCFSSMLVNEALRFVEPDDLRESLMLAAFLATVFFLCSRPWALVQKRVSVGVMLCGTINMSVSKHAKPWWYPWTIGVPCTVGLFCAVLSMLLPPRLAHVELKMRLAFQALSLRQVLVEQYAAFFTKSRTHHAAAAHLLETIRDNQLKIKTLLHHAAAELVCDQGCFERMGLAMSFFDAELSALRKVQLTTSSATQGMLSLSHMKFRKSTESAWRRCALCVAAMSDAVVRAELEGLPIPSELLEELEQSQRQLDRDVHVARREIMYHTGSLFEDAEHQANHHLQHVNRMACYFALIQLVSTTAAHAADAQKGTERRRTSCRSRWKSFLHWFQLPPRSRCQDAMKKVISMALLCIPAWIPSWREQRPEFIWSFIAASFIFSDLQGSSISTGLGRVIGTVFGGMVGFVALEWLQPIQWPAKELEIAAYIMICVTWTFFCSLSRSSPRHGYTATVAGFSIYIMVVGTLESFGSKERDDVVFDRMQEQFTGAVVYIFVEVLLWRRSARQQVNDQQVKILEAIKESIMEAASPHLTAVEGSSDEAVSTSETDGEEVVQKRSHQQREAVFRVGNAALEAAKQGLLAATFEPTLWQKPFPMAEFQRLLHTEEKVLRLLHVLYAATRTAQIESLDPDVPVLVARYCTAVVAALEPAIEELEKHHEDLSEVLHLRVDTADYLTGDAENPGPSGLGAALQLFAVQRADQKLRDHVEKHFERFRTRSPNPNQVSFSVNTTMFCLLQLSVTLTEMADRFRVCWAAENVVVHM